MAIETDDHGRWLTVAEAAEQFGVEPVTVYAWRKRYAGLEGVRVDGKLHLPELVLARCEKARRDTPQGRRRGGLGVPDRSL